MGRNYALMTTEIDEAVRLYASGISMNRIGLIFGVAPNSVRSALLLRGITLRTRLEQWNLQFKVTLERIRLNCIVDKNECWVWQGWRNRFGVGKLRTEGKIRYAHVLAYEAVHGPVPAGKEVRRDCCNRGCCNPEHLIAVTHQRNMQMASDCGQLSNGFLHSLACKNGIAKRKEEACTSTSNPSRSFTPLGSTTRPGSGNRNPTTATERMPQTACTG